jgi:hypothetical protein
MGPMLMMVLDRPGAGDFAKSQARKALATVQP